MKKHIRFDWAIKRLLRQKANFGILEGFLSELLKEDVTIGEILENESDKHCEGSDFNRVDILVRNTAGHLMLIEVLNEWENDFFYRVNFCKAGPLIQRVAKGEGYEKIKKIFSINIAYFDLGQGDDYVYVGSRDLVGMHTDDILNLNASQKKAYSPTRISGLFTTYYLLKVNKFNDLAKDGFDEWIYFLKHNEIKEDFKGRGLQEAKEKLCVDNLSIDEKRSYERYLDSKRIALNVYKTALAEGRSLAEKKAQERAEEERRQKEEAQAEEKKMLTITVQVLHESGMDAQQIAQKLQRPVEFILDILA